MAVTKAIEVDDISVAFRASAAFSRLYRVKFGRDIYKDLRFFGKERGQQQGGRIQL